MGFLLIPMVMFPLVIPTHSTARPVTCSLCLTALVVARLQRRLIIPSLWNGRKMCARRIRPPKGPHKLVRDVGMLLILNVDRLMVLSAMFNCMGNIDGIDLSDRKKKKKKKKKKKVLCVDT